MTLDQPTPGMSNLLALDGQVFFVDADGAFWVKFIVKPCTPDAARPHGLSYSLTLHAQDGRRLLGFDNAHAISTGSGPSRRTRDAYDHRHRNETILPYEYRDAGQLIEDFWTAVDACLKQQGKQP